MKDDSAQGGGLNWDELKVFATIVIVAMIALSGCIVPDTTSGIGECIRQCKMLPGGTETVCSSMCLPWEGDVKRGKAWWARLTPQERQYLYHLEHARGGSNDGMLPEGYADCGYCSTPTSWGGLCSACRSDLDKLIKKADGG